MEVLQLTITVYVCVGLGLFKEVLNYDDRHTDVTGRTRNTLAAVDVNQFIVEGNGNINYIRSQFSRLLCNQTPLNLTLRIASVKVPQILCDIGCLPSFVHYFLKYFCCRNKYNYALFSIAIINLVYKDLEAILFTAFWIRTLVFKLSDISKTKSN